MTSQTAPTPPMREFARRLLTYEAAARDPSGASASAAFRVSEKLRRHLSTLMGSAGFQALFGRALALAGREDLALRALRAGPDGSLEALAELDQDTAAEAGSLLIAHLLTLLATSIGEPLTLRLVRNVWPDVPYDTSNSGETN